MFRLLSAISFSMCAFAAAAQAADTCTGTTVNISQMAESTETTKGNAIVTTRSISVVVTDNVKAPYNYASGECAGTFISTTDGAMHGYGHCSRRDRDGDVYNEEWAFPGGGQKGKWRLIGGTGKWAEVRWSGWFEPVMSNGRMSAVRWGGNCE
jgi:hypothetical protein